MKLYYSPGACSHSPNIVAHELGLPLELVRVDTRKKLTESGADFLAINPKGYVPVLELDSGEILTEGPAIVQYLADLKPEAKLAPPAGTMARYRLQEMLGFINSEIHKTYSPMFNPAITPEAREERVQYLYKRYRALEPLLAKQPFLLGEQFTPADAYLYTVTTWAGFLKIDLSEFPALLAFQERIAARPSVQAARASESGRKGN